MNLKFLTYILLLLPVLSIDQEIDSFVNKGYVETFLVKKIKGSPKSLETISFDIGENNKILDSGQIIIKTYFNPEGNQTKTILSKDDETDS